MALGRVGSRIVVRYLVGFRGNSIHPMHQRDGIDDASVPGRGKKRKEKKTPHLWLSPEHFLHASLVRFLCV